MIYRHQLTFRLASLSVLGIALSGCGLAEWFRSYTNIDGGRDTILEEKDYTGNRLWGPFGGFFMGSTNYVRRVDLAKLIADTARDGTTNVAELPTECVQPSFSDLFNNQASLDPGQCLSIAENNFNKAYEGKDNDTEGWILRNVIQERLIMASNSACREFTQHLNTFQATGNFLLGTAAVGTGAAGALVSAAAAAKALSGTTGALSGARAEFNADIFENKFVPVITRSIDDRRRTFLSSLRGYEIASGMRPLPPADSQPPAGGTSTGDGGHAPGVPTATASPGAVSAPPVTKDPLMRDWAALCPAASKTAISSAYEPTAEYQLPPNGYQCLPLARYPLEAAIADAIYYNDLCSLDKGLENIQVALDIAKHPGLDDLLVAQENQNQLLQKQVDAAKLQQQLAGLTSAAAPAGAPKLPSGFQLKPKMLEFGKVQITTGSSLQSLTLVNNTTAAVTVSNVQPQPDDGTFSPQNTCAVPISASGGTCKITVEFSPSKKGIAKGTLLIVYSPGGSASVKMQGTGVQ